MDNLLDTIIINGTPLRQRVEVSPSGCWEWQGATTQGYGFYSFRAAGKRKRTRIHRRMLELQFGPLPREQLACHHCDNRLCCNPDHLFVGSHQDNMNDGVSKGRFARGESHYNGKLTSAAVVSIYFDKRPYQEIRKDHNVTHAMVSMIKGRKVWNHVTDEILETAPRRRSGDGRPR